SRRLAAARFDVSWEQVVAIEREGLASAWPPLPARLVPADAHRWARRQSDGYGNDFDPSSITSGYVNKLSLPRGKTMQERLQAQLAALGKGVKGAAMTEGCRQTAAWCVGRLPGLYIKFQQTNESRYGDEITRIVQALLNE